MASWVPTSTGNGTSLAVDNYGRTGSGYGSDPLDTDNPEIVKTDDCEVTLNYFGTGIHAYTKWSGGTDEWRFIGVVLQRTAGAFVGGASAQAEVRIKKEFRLEAIEDYSGGGAPLIALTGVTFAFTGAKIIVNMVLVSGSGASSVWRFDLTYEDYSTGDGQTLSSANIPYADLNVGTYRDIVLCVTCTSAGQTDFSGILDGSITLTMDGVALIDAQNIEPYINWESGNPSVLNSWNVVGLGLAGLLGPIWMVSASDVCTEDAAFPQDYSTECCSGSADPGTSSTGVPSGDPTRTLQPWTVQCTGGGTVPSESDPSAAEAWA